MCKQHHMTNILRNIANVSVLIIVCCHTVSRFVIFSSQEQNASCDVCPIPGGTSIRTIVELLSCTIRISHRIRFRYDSAQYGLIRTYSAIFPVSSTWYGRYRIAPKCVSDWTHDTRVLSSLCSSGTCSQSSYHNKQYPLFYASLSPVLSFFRS